jgi:hypothetical protein
MPARAMALRSITTALHCTSLHCVRSFVRSGVACHARLHTAQAAWSKEQRRIKPPKSKGEQQQQRTALAECAMVGAIEKLQKALEKIDKKGKKAEKELGAIDAADARSYTAYHHACGKLSLCSHLIISVAQCSTAVRRAAQHSTAQHSTAQHNAWHV